MGCALRLFAIILCVSACCGAAHAEAPQLSSGMIELGLRASMVSDAATNQSDLGVRLGRFVAAPADGLLNGELELSYAQVVDLDRMDLTLRIAAVKAIEGSNVHPSIALTAAVRQEWLGSFQRSRFPVGVELGARVLTSRRSLLRMEFQLLRVMGDEVQNFTEKRLVLGLSLLFGAGSAEG